MRLLDISIVETSLGNLECYEVTAIATHEFGESSLISYFNEQYGFVKFHYININSSETILELIYIE